jgi:MoaA/NifB/PqqE/SkfB family radical SAM enzyme
MLNQPVEWQGMAMIPPDFFRVDWSITNQCDFNCEFCGRGEETISWQSCHACLRYEKDLQSPWRPESPEAFIKEISDLGARFLHLRGGNPLLDWNYLQKIVQTIRHTSLGLIITTPGTGPTIEELLDLCQDGRTRLNIVMFGINEFANKGRGQEPVLKRQVALIDAFVKVQLPVFVTFLLSDSTQQSCDDMHKYAMDRWKIRPSFAEVCRRDSIGKDFHLSHIGSNGKPLSPWLSVAEFFSRLKHNSCTYGSFDVGPDGKLRSCAGLHYVHGDVSASGLRKALCNTSLYDTWELNKSKILSCKKCILRYACTDCSTFEIEGEHNAVIKQAYCEHDPEQGVSGKNWSQSSLVQVVSLSNGP